MTYPQQPDQPPVPDFTDAPELFIAWANAPGNWPFNPHWCPAHWLPAACHKKNGLLASVIHMGEVAILLPEDVGKPGPAWNSWFANQTEPTCCKLGDEKIAFLWELVDHITNGETCGFPSGRKGTPSCFYPKDHAPPHRHEDYGSIYGRLQELWHA